MAIPGPRRLRSHPDSNDGNYQLLTPPSEHTPRAPSEPTLRSATKARGDPVYHVPRVDRLPLPGPPDRAMAMFIESFPSANEESSTLDEPIQPLSSYMDSQDPLRPPNPYSSLAMAYSLMSNAHNPNIPVLDLTMYNAGYVGIAPRFYDPPSGPPDPDRPFQCDKCSQSFSRNQNFKRHLRIHLAVKPFPCAHCDKAFSRKDTLKRHIVVKGCGSRTLNFAASSGTTAKKDDSDTSTSRAVPQRSLVSSSKGTMPMITIGDRSPQTGLQPIGQTHKVEGSYTEDSPPDMRSSTTSQGSSTEFGSLSPESSAEIESVVDSENEESRITQNLTETFFRCHLLQYPTGKKQHGGEKRSRDTQATSVCSNNSQIASQNGQTKPTQSNGEDDLVDGDENQDRESDRKRGKWVKSPTPDGRILACPYSKYDPARYSERNHEEKGYRGCSSCLIRDIPKLKQHLARVHRRPRIYCPRCYTVFKSRDECDAHSRSSQMCEIRELPCPEKLTDDQWKAVEKRRLGLTVIESWRLIFRTIFPNVSEADMPESPFIPSSSQEVVSDFLHYFNREAPRQLMSEIRRRLELSPLIGREYLVILETALEQSIPEVIRRMIPSEIETTHTPDSQAIYNGSDGLLSSVSTLVDSSPSESQQMTQLDIVVPPTSTNFENLTVEVMRHEISQISDDNSGLDSFAFENLDWAFPQLENQHPHLPRTGEFEYNPTTSHNGFIPAA